jgi:hypothetical protein
VSSPYDTPKVDFSQPRDFELRLAHRRAFARISEAKLAADYQVAVSRAVTELIEACEAYTLAR